MLGSTSLVTQRHFYPRPPRGGRRQVDGGRRAAALISTHALREEGDQHLEVHCVGLIFISTHALREEGDSRPPHSLQRQLSISTHALREEGDRLITGGKL